MKRVTVVVGVLVVALVGAFAVRAAVTSHEDPLVIVHWSNSHPMRDGLLPQMAQQFNDAGHKTASGRRIEIKLVACDSAAQAKDLVSRVKTGTPVDEGCEGSNPTIVTPQADDWLVDVNHEAGRDVVDLGGTKSIAKTLVGIVTYRAMAECLGWPAKELGYEDIIALRADPDGWKRYPKCAHAEWGQRPLLAFTNPQTSTTGRSVLISLYSIAAGKPPGQLTTADVEDRAVQDRVKAFQQLVDHYMPGTIPLNTKIYQGPKYGHFFLMPEDNLVSLYKGNEKAVGIDGLESEAKPIEPNSMVMIYPKEGSTVNSNPAGIVRAPWVSADEAKAAQTWIDFLREDEQQRAFMKGGFRPGTSLALAGPISPKFGLDPTKPTKVIDPAELGPDVLAKIMGSWGVVKKPAIVTFVVDTSSSMDGKKLEQAKKGLTRVLDTMQEENNQVGLVTFSTTVNDTVVPVPLVAAKFDLADRVDKLSANGQTALYDAVRRGIEIVDTGDEDATRAVVVLSDGEATTGELHLDDLVDVRCRNERQCQWSGMAGEAPTGGVSKQNLRGSGLKITTRHKVQIFFIGFGDADINVGRIMAEATGAEFRGSTNEDLAKAIEEFGAYF
jgi:Ca-activated chloride channel family protein